MARFARSAGASSQTVLRLAGQARPAELARAAGRLRAELAAERASPLGRWTAHRAPRGDGEGDWLAAFGAQLAQNVANAFADARPAASSRPRPRRLADPRRRVMVVGGRFTPGAGAAAGAPSRDHARRRRGDRLAVRDLAGPADRRRPPHRRRGLRRAPLRARRGAALRASRPSVARTVVLMTDSPPRRPPPMPTPCWSGPTESVGAWDSFAEPARADRGAGRARDRTLPPGDRRAPRPGSSRSAPR